MKWVAFDLETAKQVPGTAFDWRRHRPLGIACIGSLCSDGAEPKLWWTSMSDGRPAGQMSRTDLISFIGYLESQLAAGYLPLSWNGVGFDWEVLAEESGEWSRCARLAWDHIDMMFQVVCMKGFPVALANAALGLGVPGKTPGMAGVDAPRLWAAGEFQKVFDYVAQDVRSTLAVAQRAMEQKSFRWRTQRGTISSFPLTEGWLDVKSARCLSLPDTSWMSEPFDREACLRWLLASPQGVTAAG